MIRTLRRIWHLGFKELISLRYDPVLMLFIVYAFTLDIVTAVDQSLQVRNASIAIVDEDRSPLSTRIGDAFFAPYFQQPVHIGWEAADAALDSGHYTFVLTIPSGFQADLVAGRRPDVQINVDATAVAQAFTGSVYIEQIVHQEARRFVNAIASDEEPVRATIRVEYNQNTDPRWFFGVAEMLQMITVLTMLLPAAALIREQEHGTIEHLLVMPLGPAEIMLAKVMASALVVQVGALFCLYAVVRGYLAIPLRGSTLLFLFGTFVYQFTVTAIGMVLATLVRTVAQLVLLMVLVITPMIFLSGVFTPIESMPQVLATLMAVSPMRYYVDFAFAVLFRDAGIGIVTRELLIMCALGAVMFTIALLRFRRHFSRAGR